MQQGPKLTLASRNALNTHRDTLFRLVTILVVITLSALIAFRTPAGRTAILILILPLATIAAALFLRRPALGIIAVIIGGLVIPVSIGTGTDTTINPVVLLVPVMTVLWLLTMVIQQRAIRLHHHAATYLVLALSVVAVLAFIVGQLPWYSYPIAGVAAQLGGLAVFLLSAAAFLLSAHVLNEYWLKRLVAVFLTIAAVYMLARLVGPLSFLAQLFEGSAAGSVFWIWTVSLSAGLALFNDNLPTPARVGLFGLMAVTLLIGLTKGFSWAAGWAPPALALVLLIWLRFPRWGWLLVIAAIVVAILRQEVIWQAATNEQSWWARRQAWEIVLRAAMVNPLLGLGPANYYFIVEQYTIGGWGGNWNVRFNSHNNWVDIAAQTGIIGLGVFIAMTVVMATTGLRLYRRLPNGFARAYAAACIAGLIATLASGMLGDWFLPFVYNIGLGGMRSSILFWVFLGGLLALHMQLVSSEQAQRKRGEYPPSDDEL